jgi:hypothetical protein
MAVDRIRPGMTNSWSEETMEIQKIHLTKEGRDVQRHGSAALLPAPDPSLAP